MFPRRERFLRETAAHDGRDGATFGRVVVGGHARVGEEGEELGRYFRSRSQRTCCVPAAHPAKGWQMRARVCSAALALPTPPCWRWCDHVWVGVPAGFGALVERADPHPPSASKAWSVGCRTVETRETVRAKRTRQRWWSRQWVVGGEVRVTKTFSCPHPGTMSITGSIGCDCRGQHAFSALKPQR